MKLFDKTIKELKIMVDKALSIDDSSAFNLDQELKNHSRTHGEWAAYSAKAHKLFRILEAEMDVTAAEVAAEIRQKAKDAGKPLAATAPVYKEDVPRDKKYREAKTKLIQMQEYVDLLSTVDRAFNNRAWLLIRLAKNREGSIEPHVKGQTRGSSKPVEMEEYDL
jgi:hypothetical protein